LGAQKEEFGRMIFGKQSSLGVTFLKNETQVRLSGGKNTPFVLYQEMKLQFELHVSIEPAAARILEKPLGDR